ncbi:MAG: hypothetical protein A2Y74_09420 [Actinobacteria bacterium RBG_13_63_9]|jgi:hypothetical protein|nr:MAG: hypothetical protein A2Y74_09420 [Actinobacteria bacterium RBG_13_63_9]
MERRYWVAFIVIAFVIGMVIGFGISFKASRVAELEEQVQQITRENADLKARLGAPVTPAPGATPAVPRPPTKQ